MLKCVPTHQKWPNYQEFLAHLAGCFCTCEYTNVPFWAKMVHLSGMFIYPAVRLCGVYICHQIFFVIERSRDLIYLKFVATDFSLKIISPSAGENSGDLA